MNYISNMESNIVYISLLSSSDMYSQGMLSRIGSCLKILMGLPLLCMMCSSIVNMNMFGSSMYRLHILCLCRRILANMKPRINYLIN